MQKIIFLCLIGLLILFPLQLRYGRGGYEDDAKVKLQISRQLQNNLQIKERNNLALVRIDSLKGSRDALEARARFELNLIKPNETLLLLPGNDMIKKSK